MTCGSRRRIILSGFVACVVAARCLELFQYGTLAQVILLAGRAPSPMAQQQQEPSPLPLFVSRRIDAFADRILASNNSHKKAEGDGDDDDDDDRSKRRKNYKPSLILHVGVHKTGTTTIQTDAAEHFTEALALDNYVYLGKASENRSGRVIDNTIQNTLRAIRCVDQVLLLQRAQVYSNNNNDNINANYSDEEVPENSTTTNTKQSNKIPACWNTLLQELDHYRQRNISIILSDEDYGHDSLFTRGVYAMPGYFDLLSQTLVNWNVTIVIGYRRYAEWALSSLKQLQIGTCFRRPRRGWQHEGGEACAAPWDYIPEWMHRQPWPSARVYHSYEEQKDLWQSHGFRTKILNFHHHHANNQQQQQQQQHLSTTLFCNVLTDTPHTCNYARNRPLKTKENSLGVVEAAYSNIVFAAAQRGLFNITTTTAANSTSPPTDHMRYRMTRQLLHHHHRQPQQQQHPLGNMSAFRHLPLLCPPQSELQELLNISLAVEQRFTPIFYNSPGSREEHVRSFWRMAKERKELCTVDTDTLLEGVASWSSLLVKLTESSTI